MTLGHKIALALFVHLESQRQRFGPKAANVRRYFNQVVEHQRFVKIEVDLHTREPYVEPIKDVGVRQADGSKEFGLGDLEKAQKLTVINDPGSISVRPSDVLFDCESVRHRG
jgi:hypothetical protein